MNRILRLLSAVAVLLPLSATLRAAEPVPDERLAQKITYSAQASLQEIATALTQKTGVTLFVGSGERDWRVQERRVRVEIHDLSLGDTLAGITKTLGYDLRRTGTEGQWTYRIWQSPRSRDREEALRLAETEANNRRMTDMRDQALKDAEEIKPLTPEEFAKLRQTDPWKAYLGGTEGGRAYMDLLRSLPTEDREGVKQGRKVDLNIADLSPAQQDAIRKMVSGGVPIKGGVGPGNLKGAIPNMTPTRLVFMPITEEIKKGMPDNAAMAGITFVMGNYEGSDAQIDGMANEAAKMGLGHMIPMALVPLSGSKGFGKVFANMALRLDAGEDDSQVRRDFNDQLRAGEGSWDAVTTGDAPASVSLNTPQSTAGPVAETAPRPVDPALQVEVDRLTVNNPEDLLRQLAEKTHLSYVMEWYPEEPRIMPFVPREKTTLHTFLDTVKHAGFEWEYGSGIVRLKPDDWATQRTYDVPAALIKGYRQILEAKGWFDLDLLGTLCATLTTEQIKHRIVLDKVLSEAVSEVLTGDNDALLRFYGNLSASQKAALQSPDGLGLDFLTEPQRSALALVTGESPKDRTMGKVFVMMEPDGGIRSASSQAEPRSMNVTFRVEKARETGPEATHWSRKLALPTRAELASRRQARNEEPVIERKTVEKAQPAGK